MNTSEISIRTVLSSEIELLQTIAETTFIDTYAAYNTPENMQLYIATHFTSKIISQELNNTNIHYLFATEGDHVIGYLKLNEGSAQTESKFPNTLEIERIYVLAAEQGKGYGLLLLNKSIEEARNRGLQQIWLGVWDQNIKAIGFYERNGFYKDGLHPFVLGGEPQRDYIMKFDLS